MKNFNLDLDDFSGPLDLLLHLVKESKKEIIDVNMSEIMEKYLDFIKMQEKLNIEISSEYLIIASELIHIKSKKLLNLEDDKKTEEVFVSEEDLRKRLIEYEAYKHITEKFQTLFDKRNEVYTKGASLLTEYKEEKPLEDKTLNELVDAFNEVIKRQKYLRPLDAKITKKEFSIEKRTKEIQKILQEKEKVNFIDLFTKNDKPFLIVTFLSILEMSKGGLLNIKQNKNFDKIIIERRAINE